MIEANETHPNRETIDGLRRFADFLEAHPQPNGCSFEHYIYLKTKEQFQDAIRGVGGVQKEITGDNYFAIKNFGGGVRLKWFVDRDQTCRRVVTGQRTIQRPVYKQEQIGTEEVVEDIVSWECPDSILRPTDEESVEQKSVS